MYEENFYKLPLNENFYNPYLLEDWASTKDLISKEREWRKAHNMTSKDLNAAPRKFDYNGTMEDYFKKRNEISSPLERQRSLQALLQTIHKSNDPKILDKFRAKGITDTSHVPEVKANPSQFSKVGGFTDFLTNTIGINRKADNIKDYTGIEKHEDEHGKQRLAAFKMKGHKGVKDLYKNYITNANRVPFFKNIFNQTKFYRGDPLEYLANLAGNNEEVSDKVRDRVVKRYLQGNNQQLVDRFIKRFLPKAQFEGDYVIANAQRKFIRYPIRLIRYLLNKGPNFMKTYLNRHYNKILQ